MDPSRAPPGSGTNLNSLNSTPDDSSPAHHRPEQASKRGETVQWAPLSTPGRRGFWYRKQHGPTAFGFKMLRSAKGCIYCTII
eukprot:3038468-Prymnesium_polylepis.1